MHKAAVRKPIIGGPPVSRAFHTGHEEIKGKKEKGIQVVKKKTRYDWNQQKGRLNMRHTTW